MKNHLFSHSLIALWLGIVLIALSLAAIAIAPVAAQPPAATPASAALASIPVCFVNNGQTACVGRLAPQAAATITDQVRLLTQWLIAGPTNSERAQGVASPLPDGTTLGAVGVIDQRVTINLVLPDAALKALTDQQVEDINEQFATFTPYNFPWIAINARGTLDSGYRLLSDFLPRIEIPRKEPLSPNSPSPANAGNGGNGSLSHKTVFVSAGHGWQWNSFFGTNRTQRPAFPSSPYPPGEGIVEDFNNAEAVNHLLPYLQNAGADAWTVRGAT
jgi:hypothetical protein